VVLADDPQVLERDVAGDWIGLLQDIVGDDGDAAEAPPSRPRRAAKCLPKRPLHENHAAPRTMTCLKTGRRCRTMFEFLNIWG
jgi:hypothetical protein